MATAMEERPEGGLRFFSLKDMERRGVMLEAGALHAVAREAWADIREGRAYGLKIRVSVVKIRLRAPF